eukprot:8867450-Lingulodinium_polyedra.AAC.1
MFEIQLAAGRRALFEHPAGALSWKLGFASDMAGQAGGRAVRARLCRFGASGADRRGAAPVLQPTRS